MLPSRSADGSRVRDRVACSTAFMLLILFFCSAATRDLRAQRPDRSRTVRLAGPVEKVTEESSQDGGETVAGQRGALVISPTDLTGNKRAQAAHSLLKAIHTGQRSIAERHRRFLVEILSPDALRSGDVPWLSATSIVQELRSWIPREGLPYEGISADLLPLIGVGAREFRDDVIQAVNVLVTYEKEKNQVSPTLEELKSALSRRAPTERFLRDAAAVLWQNDPRAALASLVTALHDYSRQEGGDTMMWACLDELRTRLSMYFPTPELWQRWWKSVAHLPLEEILADYQRRSEAEYAAGWRRLLERIKETQDAERVLLAIRDTLDLKSAELHLMELRLAAVTALGEFAPWVLEIPLRPDETRDSKSTLVRRGAEVLLGVIEREQFPLESPAVIQAALASLRMYQSLREVAPEAHQRLSDIVVSRLEKCARDNCTEQGIYLETVRVAGALRVTEALPSIERYLRDAESDTDADPELLSSAVIALGRLVDGADMSREMVDLLIGYFQQPRAESEKAVQDLRLVCMIALERGADNAGIRGRLLDFYNQVLAAHHDAVLPVRAILGLGTLVKANEADALKTMVEILNNRQRYSLDAVLAVVDSIASYVSPPEALHRFLPFLVTQEAAVRERLFSKVVGLVEAGGLANAALASRELLMLGIESENPLFFEYAENLFDEAALKALLDPQKLDFASRRQVLPWWNTMVHLVRIHDLHRHYGSKAGGEDLAEAKLASLKELRDEALRNEHPKEVAEFEQIQGAFQKRRELRPRIATVGGIDPAQLVGAFGELLRIETSTVGRRSHFLWIERQLASIKSPERLAILRDACLGFLRAEQSADLWEGLPDTFRSRFMSRLKDLEVVSPPPPPPPSKPAPGEAEKNP